MRSASSSWLRTWSGRPTAVLDLGAEARPVRCPAKRLGREEGDGIGAVRGGQRDVRAERVDRLAALGLRDRALQVDDGAETEQLALVAQHGRLAVGDRGDEQMDAVAAEVDGRAIGDLGVGVVMTAAAEQVSPTKSSHGPPSRSGPHPVA